MIYQSFSVIYKVQLLIEQLSSTVA